MPPCVESNQVQRASWLRKGVLSAGLSDIQTFPELLTVWWNGKS